MPNPLVFLGAVGILLQGGVFLWKRVSPPKIHELLCKEVPSAVLDSSLSMAEANFSSRHWQGDGAYIFPPSKSRIVLAKTLKPIGEAWFNVDTDYLPDRTKAHSYGARGGQAQEGKVSRSDTTFGKGFTQVMGNMKPFVVAASMVSDHLMAQLGTPFSVNAYRAPQGGESLCPHNDPQDVLILQLSGCRRWTVWDTVPPSMLPRPFDAHTTTSTVDCSLLPQLEGQAHRTFELTPGAFLSIPRGLIHRTSRCGKEPSLHWTLTGGTPYTSYEAVVSNVLKRHIAGIVDRSILGPPGMDLVTPEVKKMVESQLASPDLSGLILRSGLSSAALLQSSSNKKDAVEAAAGHVHSALLQLEEVAKAVAAANKGSAIQTQQVQAAVSMRAAIIFGGASREGAVEEELADLPRNMKWLNSSFRVKLNERTSETCNAISKEMYQAKKNPPSH